MRVQNFFILLALMIFGLSAQAQDFTQTIKGTLLDEASSSPLAGATVVVTSVNPPMGAITDQEGYFRIPNVPVGRHSVSITMPGYEPNLLSNLLVNSGKELMLNTTLQEKMVELDAVVITGEGEKHKAINEMATVSTRSLTIEEAGRYSGSLQDPARMAQNFAGVSGASDDRNDIIIRGNSPTGVLWRMEGIDIPSPNHFSTLGTTGGPVSMLNINNLRDSDFLTGAFPAEYGNALSGVFDLRLRNGNRDKREYLAQVGFNGFEFGAEGPFKKGGKASYLANYRYSTLGVFTLLGINLGTGGAVPQYQDLTFKVNIPTEKAGTFSVFGVGGLSYIEFLAETNGENNLYADDRSNFRFRSNTGIVGAAHQIFLNENTYSRLTVAVSGTNSSGEGDSLDFVTDEPVDVIGFGNETIKYSANWKLNSKINAANTLRGGILADYYDVKVSDSVLVGNQFAYRNDFAGNALLIQSYLQWQHRFGPRLSSIAGVHSQHFLFTESHVVEPRLGLKYQLAERHTLNFGTGLHSQLQPLPIYFANDGEVGQLPNSDLDFTRSAHLVLGYDWLIGNALRFKTEVYGQYLFNVPVENVASSFSMINAGAEFILPYNTNLVNEGSGYNYGLELTLEKFFSQGYYFLATSSFFNSRYQGSDEVDRNTVFNGNFVLNALGGKEFKVGAKKRNTLSLDTKVTYAGGRRFTPVDLETSRLVGTEVLQLDRAFEEQFDPYFRADLKIAFRMNHKKASQQIGVDLQNIANTQNVFSYGYNARTEELNTVYQRGFFPAVQYKVLF